MPTYQGQQVRSSRPAKDGDKGFKDDGTEQVIVTMQDGTEKCVPKDDVKQ